jgi:hypothetical protein
MPVSVATVHAGAIQPRIFEDAIVNGIKVPSTTVSFNLIGFFSYTVAAAAFKIEVAQLTILMDITFAL